MGDDAVAFLVQQVAVQRHAFSQDRLESARHDFFFHVLVVEPVAYLTDMASFPGMQPVGKVCLVLFADGVCIDRSMQESFVPQGSLQIRVRKFCQVRVVDDGRLADAVHQPVERFRAVFSGQAI